MTSRGGFPEAADSWLVPNPGARVLAVGRGSATMASRLAGRGARVTLIDPDPHALANLGRRDHRFRLVGAASEMLPFQPGSFEAVVIAQGLHLLAPGLALAEFARVLVAGGQLGLAYTTRDDSVPWVRRLAAVLQSYDPELMTARQVHSVDVLDDNVYFPAVDARTFRMWVPITRDGMLAMVAQAPKLTDLADADRRSLMNAVGAIYDASARPPDPLTLPYAVQCWRAVVDHSDFTTELEITEDGLQIQL